MAPKSRLTKLFVSAFALELQSNANAQCSFSNIYGDHMVLQRESVDTLVHGFGEAGDAVTLSIDDKVLPATQVGSDGIWRQLLPSMSGGGPHSLTLKCGAISTSLNDVLFGDVYLCSGEQLASWMSAYM